MKSIALQSNGAFKLATGLSIVLLSVGTWFVLYQWYPQPFWRASGVFGVAVYAALVHLVVTALLLLPWRNRSKAAVDAVKADVAFIAFVMSAAALWSLSFLFAGRPVALVYAVDRIELVRANEVRISELAYSFKEELRRSGPLRLWAARPSSDGERLDSIQLAMAGFDLHQRPGFWVRIQTQRLSVISRSAPVKELYGAIREHQALPEVNGAAWSRHLPLTGVAGNWVLLLNDELSAFSPVEIE